MIMLIAWGGANYSKVDYVIFTDFLDLNLNRISKIKGMHLDTAEINPDFSTVIEYNLEIVSNQPQSLKCTLLNGGGTFALTGLF